MPAPILKIGSIGWLNCIKSRELLNTDVEIGRRSVILGNLLDITRKLGRQLRWIPNLEQFADDDEANKPLDRPRSHGYEFPAVT